MKAKNWIHWSNDHGGDPSGEQDPLEGPLEDPPGEDPIKGTLNPMKETCESLTAMASKPKQIVTGVKSTKSTG